MNRRVYLPRSDIPLHNYEFRVLVETRLSPILQYVDMVVSFLFVRPRIREIIRQSAKYNGKYCYREKKPNLGTYTFKTGCLCRR